MLGYKIRDILGDIFFCSPKCVNSRWFGRSYYFGKGALLGDILYDILGDILVYKIGDILGDIFLAAQSV